MGKSYTLEDLNTNTARWLIQCLIYDRKTNGNQNSPLNIRLDELSAFVDKIPELNVIPPGRYVEAELKKKAKREAKEAKKQ